MVYGIKNTKIIRIVLKQEQWLEYSRWEHKELVYISFFYYSLIVALAKKYYYYYFRTVMGIMAKKL